MKKRILLVEDEEHLLDAIKLNLDLEGYAVTVAKNGREAVNEINGKRFDLVVLDIMLPELNGLKVCEYIRSKNKDLPVLFLSARGTTSDRVEGLKIGGDDYLPKPFDLEELLLRIGILLKRSNVIKEKTNLEEVFIFGSNKVNFTTFEISGVDNIVITKLDVLDFLEEIKICTGYLIDNNKYDYLPSSETLQKKITPIYRHFKGWNSSTFGLTKWSELPKLAQNYICEIEKLIETKISIISTGPERTQTIKRDDLF